MMLAQSCDVVVVVVVVVVAAAASKTAVREEAPEASRRTDSGRVSNCCTLAPPLSLMLLA